MNVHWIKIMDLALAFIPDTITTFAMRSVTVLGGREFMATKTDSRMLATQHYEKNCDRDQTIGTPLRSEKLEYLLFCIEMERL